jgi:hypothetical protein
MPWMDFKVYMKLKKVRQAKRLKENYALARSLGFTGTEAGVLCHWSQDRITKLATEQGKVIASDAPIDVTLITNDKE